MAGALVADRVTRPGGDTVSAEPADDSAIEPAVDDATSPDLDAEDERSCVYPDPGCSGS